MIDRIKEEVENQLEEKASVSLKYLKTKDYGFKNLNSNELKKFDKFVQQIQKEGFESVSNKLCKRDNRTYYGEPVIHYSLGKKFRIHGFLYSNRFKIIEIDPNHKVNDGKNKR